MEKKLIHRQNITLECLPNDEMDFDDVFGGPPRRFSMQEVRVRCSFSSEAIESENERLLLSPWNSEKPVFGGEESNGSSACSAVRKRHHHHQQSDDFYGDIFKGDDFSPRRIDRDRDSILKSSPSKPSPPKLEALGVSLPSQFSLPKLTKAMERRNASSPLSRFSNRANRSSMGSSSVAEGLPSSNDRFHFSIYKWGGTDVPTLINPSRKYAMNKFDSFAEGGFSSFEEVGAKKKSVSTSGEKMAEMPVEQSPVVEAVEKMNGVKTLDGKVAEKKEDKVADKGYVENAKKNEKGPKSDEKLENTVLEGDKKSGVKGKIRDFVQKFNQEGNSSVKFDDVQKGSRSYRWKHGSVRHKENKPSDTVPKDEEKFSSENRENDQKNVTFKVEDGKDEAKQFTTDTKTQSHSSSNHTNEFSTDPRRRESKTSMENLDDPLECNFLVQELSDDRRRSTQNKESSEDIKALDAKIHQWSVGKKGNIRSLLSTLQYVLWQGSDWQPIALVDLIESNSVKRAYQKALLRVHPDKLQQKGAANDHKYIAEKVLDILQEAWDHFNTLGL